MRRLVLSAALVAALAPAPAPAAGGHGPLGCVGCHGLKKNVDASTAAFCLQCHASTEEGGRNILPISAHVSHPYARATIDPRVAKVPAELLRNGRFECLSCHEPHPANRNPKYLRVDTGAKGASMDAFCAVCHPAKSDRAPGTLSGNQKGA